MTLFTLRFASASCIHQINQYLISQIQRGHSSQTSLISDFCDSQSFKSHPLFSVHADALQIFFYYDDLEVCNPLGSKAKIHKLSECLQADVQYNNE